MLLFFDKGVWGFWLYLRHKGGRGSGLVLPRGGQEADRLVVAGETVHTRLDENETEFGILVLAVTLEMLADVDGLLDQAVQVLGEGRGKA